MHIVINRWQRLQMKILCEFSGPHYCCFQSSLFLSTIFVICRVHDFDTTYAVKLSLQMLLV